MTSKIRVRTLKFVIVALGLFGGLAISQTLLAQPSSLKKSALAMSNDPESFCGVVTNCSEPMNAISDQFIAATEFKPLREFIAYSGSCFHNHPSYDPRHEHFGSFVFAKKPAETLVAGLFSFFDSEDPFAKIPEESILDYFHQRGSDLIPGEVTARSFLLPFQSEGTDLRYWFRTSGDQLFVIGRQQTGRDVNYLFCVQRAH